MCFHRIQNAAISSPYPLLLHISRSELLGWPARALLCSNSIGYRRGRLISSGQCATPSDVSTHRRALRPLVFADKALEEEGARAIRASVFPASLPTRGGCVRVSTHEIVGVPSRLLLAASVAPGQRYSTLDSVPFFSRGSALGDETLHLPTDVGFVRQLPSEPTSPLIAKSHADCRPREPSYRIEQFENAEGASARNRTLTTFSCAESVSFATFAGDSTFVGAVATVGEGAPASVAACAWGRSALYPSVWRGRLLRRSSGVMSRATVLGAARSSETAQCSADSSSLSRDWRRQERMQERDRTSVDRRLSRRRR